MDGQCFHYAIFGMKKIEGDTMKQEKINRINALYKKQKEGTLTAAEKEEQSALRAEYIAAVRNNLRATLENTSIQEPDGSIHKLKKRTTH
jgi:uncharacterized protein YnzC (UPF0291/DUF896 family)